MERAPRTFKRRAHRMRAGVRHPVGPELLQSASGSIIGQAVPVADGDRGSRFDWGHQFASRFWPAPSSGSPDDPASEAAFRGTTILLPLARAPSSAFTRIKIQSWPSKLLRTLGTGSAIASETTHVGDERPERDPRRARGRGSGRLADPRAKWSSSSRDSSRIIATPSQAIRRPARQFAPSKHA
jgi:hypothetical protein